MRRYKPPKRANRSFTGPTGLGKIVGGAIGRHGIQRQISSAMVIVAVQEYFDEALDDIAKNDVKPVSYHNYELKIACRNSAVSFLISGLEEEIKKFVYKKMPRITIKRIILRIETSPFRDVDYS